MSEEEIVSGLLAGDYTAIVEFTTEFQNWLPEQLSGDGGFPSLTGGDVLIVCDEVINSFIDDPSKIDLKKGTLKRYILKAAQNKAIDLLRARESPGTTSLEVFRDGEVPDLSADYQGGENPSVAEEFPPGVIADAKVLWSNLSEKEQRHIDLRVSDKEPKVIAEFLGTTRTAERTRWYRLQVKLKTLLEQYPALKAYADMLEAQKVNTRPS